VINVARHLINWKLVLSVQTGKPNQHYGCPPAIPHDPVQLRTFNWEHTYLHVERIPFGRLARAATQDFAASTMTLKVPPHKRHDRHAKSIMKRRGEEVNGPKVSSLIHVLHCHIIGTREGPGTFITSPELTNYVCVFASVEDWTRQIKQVRVPPARHNNGCVISRAEDTSAAKYEDHPSLVTHPRQAPNKRATDVEMRFGQWSQERSIKIRL